MSCMAGRSFPRARCSALPLRWPWIHTTTCSSGGLGFTTLLISCSSGRTSVAFRLDLGALERGDSVAVRDFNFGKGFRWQCE
jgi:hypothetical protein